MTNPKRVLLIGLRSDVVDFAKWPGLTREKLEAWFGQIVVDLQALGYAPAWCLTDRGETAAAALEEALTGESYACALVGGGVRLDPELTPLLETIVNVLREQAPDTPIAFNTKPFDTIEAIQRQI